MAPPVPVDTVDGVRVEDGKGRPCSRTRRRRHRSSSGKGKWMEHLWFRYGDGVIIGKETTFLLLESGEMFMEDPS